jgi:hypothetical protein
LVGRRKGKKEKKIYCVIDQLEVGNFEHLSFADCPAPLLLPWPWP